jgi:DNA-binding transcriptional LysR family regulator
MTDWDKFRIFHAVAEAGSFTHAGDALDLSQSAVSRQIGALEEQLKTPLFHRHARGLVLTEQGEVLHRTVRDVFARLNLAQAEIIELKDKPTGALRMTTPVAFGTMWLAPRIGQFLDLYPEITVTLIVDDEERELGMGEADCAIRIMPPRQSDLIQRHLLTNHSHIYASPAYLARFGTPRTLADLDHHRLVVYGDDPRPPFPSINWLLDAGRPAGQRRKSALMVNNVYAILRAVENGVGIAAFPNFMAQESTKIVQVLGDVPGPTYEAYFVYPQAMRNSKKISILRDFLVRKVQETQF